MVEVPTREALAALTEAANAVTPCVILGLARLLDIAPGRAGSCRCRCPTPDPPGSGSDWPAHDLLTLGLYNGDLSLITMHARTGSAPELDGTFPQPYPPAVIRAWEFDIVDDRTSHPLERDRAPTRLGSRSSIRVRLKFGDR